MIINNKKKLDGCCPLTPIPQPPKQSHICPSGPKRKGARGGALAYGSLYGSEEDVLIQPVTPPALGAKVVFDQTPGPLLGTTAVGTTDLQVNSGGVYTVSMDLSLLHAGSTPSTVISTLFRLCINDTNLVPESQFEAEAMLNITDTLFSLDRTIGRTIQIRLNAGDRLSVRVFSSSGAQSFYSSPSLTVTKLSN